METTLLCPFTINFNTFPNLIDVEFTEGAFHSEQCVGRHSFSGPQLLIDAVLGLLEEVVLVGEQSLLHLRRNVSYTSVGATKLLRQIFPRYHLGQLIQIFINVKLWRVKSCLVSQSEDKVSFVEALVEKYFLQLARPDKNPAGVGN